MEPITVKTPIKAIRAKCLDCCADQVKEIRECPIEKCSLWPYRMGRRPKTEPAVKSNGLGDNLPAQKTEEGGYI